MIDYVYNFILDIKWAKTRKKCLFVRRTQEQLFNAGMSKYIEEMYFDEKSNRNVWVGIFA